MNCAEWEERIAEEIGGDFSPTVAAHLRACQSCAHLAAEFESDRIILAAAPPVASDADYAAMRRGLRSAMRRESLRRRYIPAFVAAAAAILVLILVRSPAPVRPPASHPPVSQPQVAQAAIPTAQPTRVRRRKRPTRAVDLALLRKVTGQEAPPDTGSESPVEMRISTSNPDVTIILLQPREKSYE